MESVIELIKSKMEVSPKGNKASDTIQDLLLIGSLAGMYRAKRSSCRRCQGAQEKMLNMLLDGMSHL